MGEHMKTSELDITALMTEVCLEHHIIPSETTLELMCLAYTIGCLHALDDMKNEVGNLLKEVYKND